jgi:mannitol/fructose-specific phosphotransferase system IIA component (Ntr-type)
MLFVPNNSGSGYAAMRDSRDEVVVALIMGLTTDGAHHKQYYLEQIFRMLCHDEYVDKTKQEFQWKEGIPS